MDHHARAPRHRFIQLAPAAPPPRRTTDRKALSRANHEQNSLAQALLEHISPAPPLQAPMYPTRQSSQIHGATQKKFLDYPR